MVGRCGREMKKKRMHFRENGSMCKDEAVGDCLDYIAQKTDVVTWFRHPVSR